ncbi:MAG TPA: tetrahydrodipicolinate N-succinyltransferase N-terminal domain-containing protein, partial [Nocardioides sp.]
MTAASGYGLLTLHGDTVLDAWFPSPVLGATDGGPSEELAYLDGGEDDLRGVTREVRLVEIDDLDAAPTSTEDVWLRLHLLSHRLVQPHGVNLDGIFGLL